MKKTLLTKSLALAAVVAAAGGAYALSTGAPASVPAAQADAEENAVSASWNLAVGSLDLVEGQVNPLTAGTTSCNPNNLTFNGTGSYTVSDGVLSYSKINMSPQEVAGRNDNQYIEFTFTPSVSFTPTGFSFILLKDGWGDGRYDVEVIRGEQIENFASNVDPARNNNAALTVSDFTVSKPVTSFSSSEEPVTLRIYLYSRNVQTGSRNFGLANVTLSGLTGDVVFTPVSKIPGDMLFDNATYNNCQLENASAANPNVGYVRDGSSIVYSGVVCEEAGEYVVVAPLDHKGSGTLTVVVKDENGEVEATGVHNLINQAHGNTGSYIPEEIIRFDKAISAGVKTVEFIAATTSSYAFNLYAPRFAAASSYEAVNTLPGQLSLASTISGGGLRAENGGANVGNIKDGYKAWNSNLKVAEAGDYKVTFNASSFYNETNVNVSVINEADGDVAASTVINVPAAGTYEATLTGVPAGSVTLALQFTNVPQNGGYCINYNLVSFELIPAAVTIPAIVGNIEEGFSFEAEEGVEYKLIVNGTAYALAGSSFDADHEAFATPGKVHEVALGVEDNVGESIYVLTTPGFKAEAAADGMAAVTFIHEEGVHVLYQVGGGYDEGLSTRGVADYVDMMAEAMGMSVYKGEPVLVSKGASILAAAVADNPSDPENMDSMLMTPAAAFTADIETGVETITADDLEGAEIYDLSGRRIAGEPAAGIYIYVKNGKSVKVAVR